MVVPAAGLRTFKPLEKAIPRFPALYFSLVLHPLPLPHPSCTHPPNELTNMQSPASLELLQPRQRPPVPVVWFREARPGEPRNAAALRHFLEVSIVGSDAGE